MHFHSAPSRQLLLLFSSSFPSSLRKGDFVITGTFVPPFPRSLPLHKHYLPTGRRRKGIGGTVSFFWNPRPFKSSIHLAKKRQRSERFSDISKSPVQRPQGERETYVLKVQLMSKGTFLEQRRKQQILLSFRNKKKSAMRERKEAQRNFLLFFFVSFSIRTKPHSWQKHGVGI